MFCTICGKYIGDKKVCPYCEHGRTNEYVFIKPAKVWKDENLEFSKKSRITAGVLQLFAGGIGLGSFT